MKTRGEIYNNSNNLGNYLKSVDTDKRQPRGSNVFMASDSNKDKHSSSSSSSDRAKFWMQKKIRKTFSITTLQKRIPILYWLPKYDCQSAAGDLVAGITVALMIIPQALAYSNIVGVPIENGLYSSFLGCFVYIIFGSCKDGAVGPTATSAILTFQVIKNKGPEYATLLCFLTGVIQLLMGLLGLGFLVDFISGPVLSGLTSAAAVILIASQIKDVLGINGSGQTLVEIFAGISQNIHDVNKWDVLFGVTCIVILIILMLIGNVKFGPLNEEIKSNRFQDYLNTSLWMIGISRNAILVVLSGVATYYFSQSGNIPFQITGFVPAGFPSVKPPPFGYTQVINGTVTTDESFFDMISDMGPGIIAVALLGLLEDMAVCKAFANGKAMDATQELIAIGLCNVANSFVQAFPGTVALARSAVNNASGVRTTLGGLYTGVIVIAAILFLTPYFYFIPKATLAAVLICASASVVEVGVIKPMWKTKRSDLILCLATFTACLLLPLQYGTLFGLGINLFFILYHVARPKIAVENLKSDAGIDYLMLTPDRCLIFPSVNYVRNLVNKHSQQGIPVVINCSHISGIDYTSATTIKTLNQDFSVRQQPMLFYNLKPSISSAFHRLSPKDFIVYYDHKEIDELLKNQKDKTMFNTSEM